SRLASVSIRWPPILLSAHFIPAAESWLVVSAATPSAYPSVIGLDPDDAAVDAAVCLVPPEAFLSLLQAAVNSASTATTTTTLRVSFILPPNGSAAALASGAHTTTPDSPSESMVSFHIADQPCGANIQ